MNDLNVLIADLSLATKQAEEELTRFVKSDEFKAVLSEMWTLPEELRPEFVELVWLEPSQLENRGLFTPEGLTIQRSAFADNRPTLFCVTRHLPPGLGWEKLTVTFDNPTG